MIQELIARENRMPWKIIVEIQNDGDIISYFVSRIKYQDKTIKRVLLTDKQVMAIEKIVLSAYDENKKL